MWLKCVAITYVKQYELPGRNIEMVCINMAYFQAENNINDVAFEVNIYFLYLCLFLSGVAERLRGR